MIARTWARHITLSTSDPAVYQALRYLECDPDIRAPSEHIAYTVEPFRSYYRIAQDGVVMRDQSLAEVRAIAGSYDTYTQIP